VFKNLHASWLEAVDNFKYELEKDVACDDPSALTQKMQAKIQETEQLIRKLRIDIQHSVVQTEKETEEISNCRRRKQLAIDIGDQETIGIAGDYLVRHERSRKIFEQKTTALQNELSMREEQLQFMCEMLKKAQLQQTETNENQNLDE